MACPAIITGDEFLVRTIAHIDCQSRSLGTFGYQALGEPGSMASVVMTGLLTLFVALFGLRLLFGPGPDMRDTVFDVLKIGVVLTLAFSWPAWKTVVYDVVVDAPSEIAAVISPNTLSSEASTLPQRLQAADGAIVAMTSQGTGRQTGAYAKDNSLGGTFAGAALRDEESFGNARLFFLAGVIGSLALLRLAAGLLLALTPLAAGLLLFGMTRGLFSGWLRGLVLSILGTIGASVVLAAELAAIEPWLADALRVRELGYATPAAPIELLAMTLAFALVLVGMVWITGRIAFTRGWQDVKGLTISLPPASLDDGPSGLVSSDTQNTSIGRAERIADSVSTQIRREQVVDQKRLGYAKFTGSGAVAPAGGPSLAKDESARLGSSYRRTAHRSSSAANRRDRPQ